MATRHAQVSRAQRWIRAEEMGWRRFEPGEAYAVVSGPVVRWLRRRPARRRRAADLAVKLQSCTTPSSVQVAVSAFRVTVKVTERSRRVKGGDDGTRGPANSVSRRNAQRKRRWARSGGSRRLTENAASGPARSGGSRRLTENGAPGSARSGGKPSTDGKRKPTSVAGDSAYHRGTRPARPRRFGVLSRPLVTSETPFERPRTPKSSHSHRVKPRTRTQGAPRNGKPRGELSVVRRCREEEDHRRVRDQRR